MPWDWCAKLALLDNTGNLGDCVSSVTSSSLPPGSHILSRKFTRSDGGPQMGDFKVVRWKLYMRYTERELETKLQYICSLDGAYSCMAAHCRGHSGDAGGLKQSGVRLLCKEGRER